MKNCQICKNELGFNKHHITSKMYGGKNQKWNICYICANCHYKIHVTNEIIVEGFFLCAPNGYQLIWHRKGEESITGRELPKCFIY